MHAQLTLQRARGLVGCRGDPVGLKNNQALARKSSGVVGSFERGQSRATPTVARTPKVKGRALLLGPMPSCSPFCQRYWSSAKTATYLACVHPAPTTDSFRGEGYDIDVNGSEALFAIVHSDDKNGIFRCAIACESCGYRSCNRRMWLRLDVREGHRCDACKARRYSKHVSSALDPLSNMLLAHQQNTVVCYSHVRLPDRRGKLE